MVSNWSGCTRSQSTPHRPRRGVAGARSARLRSQRCRAASRGLDDDGVVIDQLDRMNGRRHRRRVGDGAELAEDRGLEIGKTGALAGAAAGAASPPPSRRRRNRAAPTSSKPMRSPCSTKPCAVAASSKQMPFCLHLRGIDAQIGKVARQIGHRRKDQSCPHRARAGGSASAPASGLVLTVLARFHSRSAPAARRPCRRRRNWGSCSRPDRPRRRLLPALPDAVADDILGRIASGPAALRLRHERPPAERRLRDARSGATQPTMPPCAAIIASVAALNSGK